MPQITDAERQRIEQSRQGVKAWRRWGPYLSERQWGTVREDYSPGGTAWDYFTHDQARSRAYRWGEDGIGGVLGGRPLIFLSGALLDRPVSLPQTRVVRPPQFAGQPRRDRTGALLVPPSAPHPRP